MEYAVIFQCSDISFEVFALARNCNQDIVSVQTYRRDMRPSPEPTTFIRIEFKSNRRFEMDMFLASLNARKSEIFYNRYEVKS